MISIFAKTKETTPQRNMDILAFFDAIKHGEWQDIVLAVRTGKAQKIDCPAVTASGVFKTRKAADLIEHSGTICIDIDAQDQIAPVDIEAIQADPYLFAIHRSISGRGFAAYYKIDPAKHLDAFLGLEQYLFVNYSIVVDKSCKDVSRLRYVSYDPELFLNEKAKTFKKYLKKAEKANRTAPKPIVVKSDFDEAVRQAQFMNLYDDYQDYIQLAFALVDEFGESGRSYFHSLCASSQKYDAEQSNKDYDKCMKRTGTGITIASVYWKFKQAGIKIESEKTEIIKKVKKLSDNPTEDLKKFNITDDEGLLDKLPGQRERTKLDEIADLIQISGIRFNEVTRKYEMGDQDMDDRLLSNFYTQVWQKIDEDIAKDKVWTMIQNPDVTPSYNPIIQWFERHKDLQPKGYISELIDCFEVDHKIFRNGQIQEVEGYLEIYMVKWLLGLIGSAYGTYSLMILVLNGEQGTNKTEFFRNLLPYELRNYYAESNLDEGKDSEILMTKKWLIVDDEFGGKSKRDATKLKRMSSQQIFTVRMPYGRMSEDLKRLAVLAGTSNDFEVINDPTGNRRIVPINLVSLDIDRFKKIDKDLLFIELYHYWAKNKDKWFLTKEEIDLLGQISIKNTEVMPEVEAINELFIDDEYGQMTNTAILGIITANYPALRTNSKRIGQALKICGYEQDVKKIHGKTQRVYNIVQIGKHV